MNTTIERKVEPIIFDTTLREGLQTPGGIGGTLEEKLYAAANIQRFANWIELGIPANDVDYKIIETIKERFLVEGLDKNVGVAVLARCMDLDIKRSAELIGDYHQNMIHLFLGTSEEHRSARFGGKLDKKGYLDKTRKYAYMASSNPAFDRIMFSPEDAYRTWSQDKDFMIDIIRTVKEAYEKGNVEVGRKARLIFNLPDTVGKSTIMEFGQMIEHIQSVFGDEIELSIHGHNDSGHSQSQAMDVYQRYGVQCLQTTFAQLGERNGIASTDRMIKDLVERDYLTNPRITDPENLKELDKVTKAILMALGRQVPLEHLDRINVSTAGIHTDLTIKDSSTYHIFGDRYGSELQIELGPTSGSNQVKEILEHHGVDYDSSKLEEFTLELKTEANKRKSPISITHILYEAEKKFNEKKDGELKVRSYRVTTLDTGETELKMEGSIEGKYFDESYKADGPVEAAMELLNYVIYKHRGTDYNVALEDYRLRVIPKLDPEILKWEPGTKPKLPEQLGANADLAVDLVLKNGTGTYHGWARHENSTNAEINAVIDGMTKMYSLQKWHGPAMPAK